MKAMLILTKKDTEPCPAPARTAGSRPCPQLTNMAHKKNRLAITVAETRARVTVFLPGVLLSADMEGISLTFATGLERVVHVDKTLTRIHIQH